MFERQADLRGLQSCRILSSRSKNPRNPGFGMKIPQTGKLERRCGVRFGVCLHILPRRKNTGTSFIEAESTEMGSGGVVFLERALGLCVGAALELDISLSVAETSLPPHVLCSGRAVRIQSSKAASKNGIRVAISSHRLIRIESNPAKSYC